MYTPVYNKRRVLKFKQFNNHGYSLFSVLGKEVIIGVLSVATLRCAMQPRRPRPSPSNPTRRGSALWR